MLLGLAGQPQRWPMDVVAAASMAHGCGCPRCRSSIDGPSLRSAERNVRSAGAAGQFATAAAVGRRRPAASLGHCCGRPKRYRCFVRTTRPGSPPPARQPRCAERRYRQPQFPPQQPPPLAGAELPARPPTATVESKRTVSPWPCGQVHGAEESLIGRVSSKVSPQARQRYSYLGIAASLPSDVRPQVDGAVPAEALRRPAGLRPWLAQARQAPSRPQGHRNRTGCRAAATRTRLRPTSRLTPRTR